LLHKYLPTYVKSESQVLVQTKASIFHTPWSNQGYSVSKLGKPADAGFGKDRHLAGASRLVQVGGRGQYKLLPEISST